MFSQQKGVGDQTQRAQLDAARHPTDLLPGDRVWIDVDLAQHGLGSASCGPDVLPGHGLTASPTTFSLLWESRKAAP